LLIVQIFRVPGLKPKLPVIISNTIGWNPNWYSDFSGLGSSISGSGFGFRVFYPALHGPICQFADPMVKFYTSWATETQGEGKTCTWDLAIKCTRMISEMDCKAVQYQPELHGASYQQHRTQPGKNNQIAHNIANHTTAVRRESENRDERDPGSRMGITRWSTWIANMGYMA